MFNEIFGGVFAGFGLFLVALKLLEFNMHDLTSGSLRGILKKQTSSDFKAGFWGMIMACILAEPAVVSCLAGSFYSGKSISFRRAAIMGLWSNLGSCLFLFILFFNIELLVLFMLGVTAISFYLEKPFTWRYAMGAAFSITLLLYALQVIETHSDQLLQATWIQDAIKLLHSNYFISYIVAAVLMVAIQADMVLLVLFANLVHLNSIPLDQAMIMVFGLELGLATIDLLMAISFKAHTKKIFFISALVDLFIGCIFPIFLFIENWTGIPMLKALITHLSDNVVNQLVFLITISNLISTVIIQTFLGPIINFMNYLFPGQTEQRIAEPQFIDSASNQDPETAITLAEQELFALFKRLPVTIECKLSNDPISVKKEKLTSDHESYTSIADAVDEYLKEIQTRNLGASVSGHLIVAIERLQILKDIEEGINQLCLMDLPDTFHDKLKILYSQLLEVLEALILTVGDAIETLSEEDIQILITATTSSTNALDGIRKSYSDESLHLSGPERIWVLNATSIFDRDVWLLKRLICQFVPSVKPGQLAQQQAAV